MYMKLDSFSGEAIIGRKVRYVKFEEGELTICGLSLEEAWFILGEKPPAEVEDTNPPWEAQTAKAEETLKEIREITPAAKQESKPTAKETAKRTLDDDELHQPQDETSGVSTIVGQLPDLPEPEILSRVAADTFVEALAEHKKMRFLLPKVAELTGNKRDGIIGYCVEHQAKIPLLANMGENIVARVEKSLDRLAELDFG